MLKKIFYFLNIIMIIISSGSYAANYYIDINGSDSNTGDINNPFKTLQKAIDVSSSGDIIKVNSGTYETINRITIYDKSNITIEGNSFQRPKIVYLGQDVYCLSVGDGSSSITINNIILEWNSDSFGNLLGINGDNITISNCELFFSKNLEKYDGIKINATANTVKIENCKVYNAPDQGIDSVGGENLTIQGCEIYNCQNGIVLKGGTVNNVISNNILYNFEYGAIGLGGTTDPVFNQKEYEIAYSNVFENIIYYDDFHNTNIGGGIFLMGAQNCTIYNNSIYGAGIHIKPGGNPNNPDKKSANNAIHNNIIWRTGNDGFLVVSDSTQNNILQNNLFWKTSGSGEFKIDGAWFNYNEFVNTFDWNSGSMLGDPQFLELENQDVSSKFKLSEQSPAIGAGIFGNDLGAIQFSKKLGRVKNIKLQ